MSRITSVLFANQRIGCRGLRSPDRDGATTPAPQRGCSALLRKPRHPELMLLGGRGVIAVSLLMLLAGAGCDKLKLSECKQPSIGYYLAPPEELQRVRSVVFFPLACSQEDTELADNLTQSLFQAVQQRRLFDIQMARRDDELCGGLEDPSQAISLEQLSAIRARYNCDAVLVGQLYDFLPHPRMRMGLRLRLVDLKRGKLLWGVDNIWDTTDEAVLDRIRKYYCHDIPTDFKPVDWRLAIVSPREFGKFVAYESAVTLCPAPPDDEECDDCKEKRTKKAKSATKAK